MAEESIYDLIPKPKKEKKKPARYKSRYPGNVAPSYSTFGRAIGAQHTTTNVSGKLIPPETSHQYKNAGATFGSPNKHKADFQAFKSRKAKELPKPRNFTYTDRRKVPLDAKLDKKKIPKREKVNFITKNAVETIMKATKKPTKKEERYVNKSDYGKVPDYLKGIKQDIEAEKHFIDEMLEKSQAGEAEMPKQRVMDEAEKEELLTALKLKWQEVNEQYQKISHIVKLDTIGKLRKKERFEAELSELEAAIEKLSRGPVLVADDRS